MSHRKSRSQFSADGHKKFEAAQNSHLAQSKKQNLAEAEGLYQKCLEKSKSSDEKASSYKNLATLNWWAAKDAWNFGQAESLGKQNEGKERLKKCVENILGANDSMLCKKYVDKWVHDFIGWSNELLDAHPASFMPVMTVVCRALETEHWGAKCYLKIAKSIIEHGTKWLGIESSSSKVPGEGIESSSSKVPGEGGYEKCRTAMQKCEEILQLLCTENIDLKKRVKYLKRDVQKYREDCEAIQRNIEGEGYLEKGMNGEAGMISAAIDSFNLAVKTANRAEHRAFAYSRLGKLHFFLGDDSKAHHNHNRSVDIAGRVLSSQVESAEWYIYSRAAVEKHLMKETTEKITAVEKEAEKAKNLMYFIKYLFENHPHPNKEKPGFLSSKVPVADKIAWNEAARTYHPDKNKQESKYWQRLCDAIMKELNKKKPM